MEKISNLLSGIKVVDEVDSPINGKLTVVKSLAFGTYIQAGGLTQSGGIIKRIWNKALNSVSIEKSQINNVLVLGLGGGSIVEIISKYWPEAKITAVDVDPVIVQLGEKYLGLDRRKMKVVISDAEHFLERNLTKKQDLILVDLYNGDQYPEKFETEKFAEHIKSRLKPGGVAVFNRLYYGDKRPHAMRFLKKLEKAFARVDVVYPEANVMFICFSKYS